MVSSEQVDAVNNVGLLATKGPGLSVRPERWEMGSAFPLIQLGRSPDIEWLPKDAVLYGTGRQAIRALLRHGRDVLDWRRVLIPSYGCPDIVRALHGVLPIVYYPCSPDAQTAPPKPRQHEVVLVTSFFGMPPQAPDQIAGSNVVLDVTHDPIAPWLDDVDVGYVVASLRKTLPVPDGAVIWSPRGHILPKDPPPASRHIEAVAAGVRAMYLKSKYLDGADVEKRTFLRLFASMEKEFMRSMPARISAFSRELIGSFPVHEWRCQRLSNIHRLTTAVSTFSGLTVLPSTFGVVLLLEDHARRERFRQGLLEAQIYPAILWPMDNKDAAPADRNFSQRMLFLHADFRWGEEDMLIVAEQIAASLGQRGGTGVGQHDR